MRYYSEATVNGIIHDMYQGYDIPKATDYPSIEITDNPWHTGTPTITGFYAVKFKDGSYDVILYDNGKVFEGDDPLCGWDIYSDDKPEDIIKWQLLEEATK